MKNKTLYSLFILFNCCLYAQTNNKTGINIKTPSETIDVNGTARLRSLPLNGTSNSINTKSDGSSSSQKDQTFNATKTVVVDENGVIGTIDGLAITEAPDVKTIQYVRKTVPINAFTPDDSVTILGNLSIRYNTKTTGTGKWVEFSSKVPNQITSVARVDGAGGTGYIKYDTTSAAPNSWYNVNQSVTASNRDTYSLTLTLHNTQEIYRVSLICNAAINASTSPAIPSVPAQVTIFIEKLE